jgi:predicted DNA-binding protein (MmcQ/YjbR family)
MTSVELQFQAEVRELINSLPRTKKRPDSLSEEAYFYDNGNFAHFHGPRHIDIRLSPDDQKDALAKGKAHPHLYAPQKGWVSCALDTREHVENAKELVRKAYDHCEKMARNLDHNAGRE